MSAKQRCHGNGVEQQLKHAMPTVTDAPRPPIKSTASFILTKIVSPKLNVLRRPTFFVKEPLSVTSSAVIATTATLALYLPSAVSCS